MGTFVAYTFASGIYLLAAYLMYKWLLSGENQSAFNRVILLTLYAFSMIMPLFPSVSFTINGATIAVPEIEIGNPDIAVIGGATIHWTTIVVYVYFIGMAIVAITTSISFFRLISIIKKGRKVKAGNYTIILLPTSELAPFSWLRYIVMSESDYAESREMIVCHENSHLHLLHWIDLLFAQLAVIVLWYNPASWLMRTELRNVHEYQADNAVLKSGADASHYQLLLIKKAVGQRFPSLANSLNHSKLKKRITMMCNPKTGKGRRMRALAVVPAFAAALVLTNIPSVANTVSKVAEAPLTETIGKVIEKTDAVQKPLDKPDVLPEFVGGEEAMFKYLIDTIIYPEVAATRGEQGRVVVSFIVEADGSISNCEVVGKCTPELDAEAIRVVSNMPKWIPGRSGGAPVRCTYTLPISFKLN